METIEDACHRLSGLLYSYPWFAKKVIKHPSSHNAIIAYVHLMNAEVFAVVPDKCEGYDVKVHFIASAPIEPGAPSPYVSSPQARPAFNPAALAPAKPLLDEEPVFTQTLDVHNEIWKLQRVCGKDALTDIFYEIHDGDDAVTELSEEYPAVRAELQKLYNEFGFDVLFEELDA